MVVNDSSALKKLYKPLELQQHRVQTAQPGISEKNESFSETLKTFVGEVNSVQKESASHVEKFVKGEPIDLHDVMISAEKAKTTFQLLLEMRNKALESYRELIRIQV